MINVQYIIQIVTLVVNTLACAVLIKLGSSIQMVKLTTSLIYLVRPLLLLTSLLWHLAASSAGELL